MSKATLLFEQRMEFSDGSFAEMILWEVPTPVPALQHRLKYSLVYIVGNERIIGYDNERGKGDHRHVGGREEPFRFTTVENLIASFYADIHAVRSAT